MYILSLAKSHNIYSIIFLHFHYKYTKEKSFSAKGLNLDLNMENGTINMR